MSILPADTIEQLQSLGPVWQSTDGRIVLCNCDCLEGLKVLPEGCVDAVVTDPVYGISNHEFRSTLPSTKGRVDDRPLQGDESLAVVDGIMRWLPPQMPAVIWGANNFPHLLPHKGRWLCWDKRITEAADRMLGSAFELAWSNRHGGFGRMIRCLHGGVVNADKGRRCHPTQKPVAVMRQCVEYTRGTRVIDMCIGSGTTAIACIRTDRSCIGMEIDKDYWAVAVSRCEREYARTALLDGVGSVETRKQGDLFE